MTTPLTAADPQRTALLVMDFQQAVVSILPEDVGPALVRRTADAVATVRAAGGTVAYVRVGFSAEDLAAIPAANKAFSAVAARAVASGRDMSADGPGTAVVGELAPHEGDIIVRKTRVGGFSTTDLHEQLTGRGITTLVLSGISTSGVVLSTLRDAADRDYRLLVLADACADPDPQVHRTLMERVFPHQADIATVAELEGLLTPVTG